MNMTVLVFVISLSASFIAVYGPGLFFFGNRTLSGKELAEVSPELARVGIRYQVLGALWSLSIGLILAGIGIWVENRVGIRVLYLGSAFLASAGIFVGLFAALTGIYPEGGKLTVRYIYEPGERVRRVGKFQAGFALAVAMVSILLVFVELR